ncbi:MAG: hypothetical protein Q8M07_04870 [Prosthecobacter sp.]|nr:hypothetical protein [Prosthecobacter sp.]
MTTPSSPLEAFQSAACSVLGRITSFCLACSLGGGTGYVVDHWSTRGSEWFIEGFLLALAVVPAAFVSFLTSYGLIVFPFCLLFAFAFIRFELSFWCLLIPFTLVAWQTAALRMGL